jgi:hypothetical protein
VAAFGGADYGLASLLPSAVQIGGLHISFAAAFGGAD